MDYKPYAITEEGEIEIIDSRKYTRGTVVLDYIDHLYTPIIGFVGKGLYTTILSFQNMPKIAIKLHALMKHGGIGWKVLKDQLELMERLGFWKIHYPTGKDKRSHKRTAFELLDVPIKVPVELVEHVLTHTIVRDWLFAENVSTEKQLEEVMPTDVFGEPVVGSTVQAEKKAKVEPKTAKSKKETSKVVPQILKLYESMLPEPRRNALQWNLEGKWATQLEKYAVKMEWSVETLLTVVERCWRENDPKWTNGLSLYHLYATVLPNWVVRNPQYNTLVQEAQEPVEKLPLTLNWKDLKPTMAAFWTIGNRYPATGGTCTVEMVDGEIVCWHEQEERVTLRGKNYGFSISGTST